MAEELLVNEQISPGAELSREFSQKFPVEAAFWINPSDSELWYLYLTSPTINDSNFDLAYGEVLRLFRARQFGLIDPFQIKVLNSADPLSAEVTKIRDRFRAPLPTRYNGSSIGGLAINGAYIYPKQVAATSTP